MFRELKTSIFTIIFLFFICGLGAYFFIYMGELKKQENISIEKYGFIMNDNNFKALDKQVINMIHNNDQKFCQCNDTFYYYIIGCTNYDPFSQGIWDISEITIIKTFTYHNCNIVIYVKKLP